MMQAYYQKLLINLLFKTSALAINVAVLTLFVVSETQSSLFYYGFLGLIGPAAFLGLSLGIDYLKIQKLDFSEKKEKEQLSNVWSGQIALEVLSEYCNDWTYQTIKNKHGLSENVQVTRLIKEAARKLLKEHHV